MILFVNDNNGILFFSGIRIVIEQILEFIRKQSRVTLRLRWDENDLRNI